MSAGGIDGSEIIIISNPIIKSVMSAGGIDGSDFSRRKKHPDLAYRAHQVNKQIKTKHKVLILKVIQKYLVIEIYI